MKKYYVLVILAVVSCLGVGAIDNSETKISHKTIEESIVKQESEDERAQVLADRMSDKIESGEITVDMLDGKTLDEIINLVRSE